jgi:hypothetical protein
MEYKIKENVNVNSLIFRKKVIEETIDLMGGIKNYTKTNIKFNLMLGFLDNVIDGDTLLESLAESTRLINEIEDKIEPLYQKIIADNETNLKLFNELFDELEEYCNREVENNRRMTGFLYTILEELGSITPEEVMNLVNQVVDLAANHFVPKANTKELKKAEPIKTAEEIKIENEKILELVNKFANYKNTAE